jgi:hypothetical protein
MKTRTFFNVYILPSGNYDLRETNVTLLVGSFWHDAAAAALWFYDRQTPPIIKRARTTHAQLRQGCQMAVINSSSSRQILWTHSSVPSQHKSQGPVSLPTLPNASSSIIKLVYQHLFLWEPCTLSHAAGQRSTIDYGSTHTLYAHGSLMKCVLKCISRVRALLA